MQEEKTQPQWRSTPCWVPQASSERRSKHYHHSREELLVFQRRCRTPEAPCNPDSTVTALTPHPGWAEEEACADGTGHLVLGSRWPWSPLHLTAFGGCDLPCQLTHLISSSSPANRPTQNMRRVAQGGGWGRVQRAFSRGQLTAGWWAQVLSSVWVVHSKLFFSNTKCSDDWMTLASLPALTPS